MKCRPPGMDVEDESFRTQSTFNILNSKIKEEGVSSSSCDRPELAGLCRVCLKKGSIPIYGANDLSHTICVIADIELSEDDDYPKYLCKLCYVMLNTAIKFRHTAKKSEVILRNPIHETTDRLGVLEMEMSSAAQKHSDESVIKMLPKLEKCFTILQTGQSDCKKKSIKARVQCRVCLKIVSRGSFRQHFLLHDQLSKYICETCGQTFKQQSAYRNHCQTHVTDFPFKCDQCPYKGKHAGLLKTHMLVHSGEYKFMCLKCPAKFLTKSNYNRHCLKHKERAFKCEGCERAFHTQIELEQHIKADHMGIKNHICDICSKAFGYRKAMMRHQIDVHKREKKMSGRTPSYIEAEKNALESMQPYLIRM